MRGLPRVRAWAGGSRLATLNFNGCLHCFLVGKCGVAGALSC